VTDSRREAGGMTDRQLVFEDFKDRSGTVFTPTEPDVPAIPLTLTEVKLLPANFAPPGARPPFYLMFVGAGDTLLPQRLYRLKQDDMGEVTIFIVPVGKDEHGISYQATFN
jgi:hypothetical protein